MILNATRLIFCFVVKLFFFVAAFQMPPGMEKLTRVLRNLDLSGNKLTVIPPAVGNFQMLKYLSANNNRLGKLRGGWTRVQEIFRVPFRKFPSSLLVGP